MKTITLCAALGTMLLFVGCGKKAAPSTSVAAAPITQPAMMAWQQGDKSAAISRFVETDWSARPLFPSDWALSLTESEWQSLSRREREARSGEMLSQLNGFKLLAAEVARAGSEAASKNDLVEARRCFTSLKQCGVALCSTQSMKLVQLVGTALQSKANAEMAKIQP